MVQNNKAPRAASESMPPLKDQGVFDVVGSPSTGKSLQSAQVTQAGASPFVVDLEAIGLRSMADTAYVVIAEGETAARVTVDQSTITEAGFSLLGGADTEVIHLMVMGRVRGQASAKKDPS